jgi:ABC-type antimicrobial peptide transport system permease subunit
VIKVALRGLAGRKLRAALTAFAIVLGVAMVSGTLVLTDAIDKAFKNIFTEQYAGTDAVISGKQAVSFQGDNGQKPSVPASLLDQIRKHPDVAAATGLVADQSAAKILDNKGKVISTGGAPAFGFGVDFSQARFNPLRLQSGNWPASGREVAIDASTADKQHFKVGDNVRVASLGPVQSFRLSGIATYGKQKSLGSATFTVFTVPTAQRLFDRKNQFDAIWIAAKSGVSPQRLVADLKPILPPNVEALSSKQQTKEDLKSVSFTKFIRYLLLSFAGIALFVGAFVIFNTMSITVAQRVREFATLRTIGASRRQLLTTVTLEAFIIGALASVAGLLGGLLLARGVNALFKAVNNDLPVTALNLTTSTVIYSLLLGTTVTLLAGLFPAIRATRVPPIAAVREGATLPPSRFAKYTAYIALVVVALAVALLTYGMFGKNIAILIRLLSLAIGCLALFIGVALLSPKLVPWLAAIVRPIAKWLMVGVGYLVYPTRLGAWLVRSALFRPGLSIVGRLASFVGGVVLLLVIGPGLLAAVAYLLKALSTVVMYLGLVGVVGAEVVLVFWLLFVLVQRLRGRGYPSDVPEVSFDPATDKLSGENARRAPGRTAATAAALMIGLALVTFITVLANGMKGSNRGAIEKQVTAQYMLTGSDGFTPIPPAAGNTIARSPAVAVVSNVRQGIGKMDGATGQVTGIDPKTIAKVYAFDWKKGSDRTIQGLTEGGAIVDKKFADDKNLTVGSTFKLLTPSGKETLVTVRGIYKAPPFFPLLGNMSILQSRFDQLYERPRNIYTFVNARGGPGGSAKKALEAAVAEFPDAKVQTRNDWIKAQDKDFNNFLLMLYVLLALSVIVSVFGMINTLVLSVFERTRELGMLRAVGMTRYQVSRMVRQESVITALIGAALGLPLGVFLAALVTKALSQFNVQFSPPWRSLIAFAIVAMIVGVVAAVAPARRASRLNVLRALQYE